LNRWKSVINKLKISGYEIVEIGSKFYLGIGENKVGKKIIHETAELIATAEMYLGFDGGLMHIAQSVGTPILIIFGCTCPNYRIHDWSKARVLWLDEEKLACAGCHHKLPAPRCQTDCNKEKIHCLDGITEEMVFESFYGAPGKITKPLSNEKLPEVKKEVVRLEPPNKNGELYVCDTHTKSLPLIAYVAQKIDIPVNAPNVITGINILLGTYNKVIDCIMKIEIMDKLSQPIHTEDFQLVQIGDNGVSNLKFKEPIHFSDRTFKIKITAINPSSKIALFIDEKKHKETVLDYRGARFKGRVEMTIF
jgi:hypothetical protein